MERLLFMDVKIIAFELPTRNHKNNDQGLQGNSLRKGSLKLRDMVAGAAKNEFSYDDIISDITELF